MSAAGRLVLFGDGHEELGLSVVALAIATDGAPPDAWDAARDSARAVAEARRAAAGDPRESEPRRVAERAHASLRGSSRAAARADALACALGGLHHFQFGPTPFVQELPIALGAVGLVACDEAGAIGEARRAQWPQLQAALADLAEARPELDLARLSFDEAWNLQLDAPARRCDAATRERLLFAALQSRDLLLAALQVAATRPFGAESLAHLGELLDRDHVQLAQAMGVRSLRIDALRRALLAAGALGVRAHGRALLVVARDEAWTAVAAAAAREGTRATRVSAAAPASRG